EVVSALTSRRETMVEHGPMLYWRPRTTTDHRVASTIYHSTLEGAENVIRIRPRGHRPSVVWTVPAEQPLAGRDFRSFSFPDPDGEESGSDAASVHSFDTAKAPQPRPRLVQEYSVHRD